MTGPKSHSSSLAEPGLKPRSPGSFLFSLFHAKAMKVYASDRKTGIPRAHDTLSLTFPLFDPEASVLLTRWAATPTVIW